MLITSVISSMRMIEFTCLEAAVRFGRDHGGWIYAGADHKVIWLNPAYYTQTPGMQMAGRISQGPAILGPYDAFTPGGLIEDCPWAGEAVELEEVGV